MLSDQDVRHVEDVAEFLGLSEYVVEKDFYVTRAIAIVSQVSHDCYDLIFQGGTSLAKAHRIIERMSEDCDFRMRINDAYKTLSQGAKRKALRQFRHKLIIALQESGFLIDGQAVRVRDEGRFMNVRAGYPSMFPQTKTLKSYIALDFFLTNVKVPPEKKIVTTLIRQVFGDNIDHAEFEINSTSIIETAAEKWVGLTRRIATSAHRRGYDDANLVRHLYDLYKIHEGGYFSDQFSGLVFRVVLEDRSRYKNHNDAYYQDPVSEIKRAVNELHESTKWHDNWDQFVDAMVFAKEKPTYEVVLDNLYQKTTLALESLESVDFSCVTA